MSCPYCKKPSPGEIQEAQQKGELENFGWSGFRPKGYKTCMVWFCPESPEIKEGRKLENKKLLR